MALLNSSKLPLNRNFLDKTTMGHLHNGTLLVHKKEEKFTLCDSMNGHGEHYAK